MEALFAWAWQGSLLTAVAALALRVAPRLSAATRHLVWWTTLACVVALPLLYVAGATDRSNTSASSSAAAAGTRAVFEPWRVPAPPDWFLAVLLGAWLGVVLLSSVRVARGVTHVRRLAGSSAPMPAAREARLRSWTRTREIGRPMDLRVSCAIGVPCALGLGRGTVLVPASMLEDLCDDDLDKLVMHERAHLLRYDDWTRLVQAVVSTVAGMHPAVAWINRQIDLEREAACDDLVVKVTGDAHGYAACLAEAASVTMGRGPSPSSMLAPGALQSRGALERRIRRLLDQHRGGTSAPSPWLVLASACGLLVGAQGLARTSPLVRFVEGAGAPPAAASAAVDVASATASSPGSAVDLAEVAVQAGTAPSSPARTPRPAAQAASPSRNARRTDVVRVAGPEAASLQRLEGEPAAQSASAQPPHELLAALPVDLGVRPTTVDVTPSGTNASVARGERSPWSDVARAGTGVGTGTKKAGQAVAGFFARAGSAVGNSF